MERIIWDFQPGGPALGSAYLTVKGSEPLLTNYDDYDGNHPADWYDYFNFHNGLIANFFLSKMQTIYEVTNP